MEVFVSPFRQNLEAFLLLSCHWHQILAWVWVLVLVTASYFFKLELDLWAAN